MVDPSTRHQLTPLIESQVGTVSHNLSVAWNVRNKVQASHQIQYNILRMVGGSQKTIQWWFALDLARSTVEVRWDYLPNAIGSRRLMWKYFAPYPTTVQPPPAAPAKIIVDTRAVIPHLSLPFVIGERAAVTEQDTIEEIAHCVEAILRYPQGYRLENIEFGLPEQLFKEGGADLEDFREAVRRWEPRANALFEESPDRFDELISMVRVIVRGRMDIA